MVPFGLCTTVRNFRYVTDHQTSRILMVKAADTRGGSRIVCLITKSGRHDPPPKSWLWITRKRQVAEDTKQLGTIGAERECKIYCLGTVFRLDCSLSYMRQRFAVENLRHAYFRSCP